MSTRTILMLCAMAVLGLVAVQPAHATTILWSATAGDSAWATGTNWDGNVAPADDIITDIASFSKTSYTFQPDAGTRSITGIEIGDVGGTVTPTLTISGTDLKIGASGVTMYANAGAATVSSAAVTLGASQAWTNNSANTLTVSGAIGGAFDLTKAGTGTLILSGANGYTGVTGINAGILQANNAAALGNGGNITFGGGTLQFTAASAGQDWGARIKNSTAAVALDTNTQNVTFAGAVDSSNTGGLAKSGAGSLILSGANTYTGTTTIAGGVLQFNLAGSIGGSGRSVVVGANTMAAGYAIDNAFLQRIDNTVQPTGTIALAVDSGNNLDFNSDVNGANLSAAYLGAIGNVAYTGTLTPNGTTYRLGGGGGTLTLGNTNAITGVGNSLVVNGNVTLAAANDYTGATTINAGTLQAGSSTAFGPAASASLVFGPGSTGTVQLYGNSMTVIGLNTNAGSPGTTYVENGHATTAATLTVNNATANTFAGVLRDGGAASLALTKTGAGTLTITTAQSYTGPTLIDSGTLKVQGPLGPVPPFRYYKVLVTSSYNIANGLQYSEMAFYSSGTNNLNGTRVFPVVALGDGGSYGDAGLPGLWDGNLGTKSYMGGAFPRFVTYDFGTAQVFTGYDWATANDLTPQRNPNDWTVLASNDNLNWITADTQTGQGATPTTLTTWAPGWALAIPASNLLPVTTAVSINSGATLDLTGNQQVASLADAVPGATGQVLLRNSVLTVGDATSTTFSGAISGTGGLAKIGSGTLTLAGASTYNGTTAVNDGTLQISVANALPITTALTLADAAGAVFNLNGNNQVIGSLSGGGLTGGNVTLGANTLTVGTDNTSPAAYAGVISGTGGLIKTGAGTLTLSNANTYTGTTTLAGGTLKVSGAAGSINASTGITLNGGSNLLLTNTSSAEGSVDRVKNDATITSNGCTITYTNTSGNSLVYGETLGPVALTAGQLYVVLTNNMAGTANTQTLTLSALNRTGASNTSAVGFASATALNATTNMIKVTGAAQTPAGQIIAPWATTGTAANTQTDYAIYDASTNIVPANIAASAETTWLDATKAYTMGANQTLTATRNMVALRRTGGTLTLALGCNLGTTGILGSFTINPGTGGVVTLPSTTAANLYVTPGNGDMTINAPIQDNIGALTLVKSGGVSGGGRILTLTAINTYSGGTVINSGFLRLSTDAALGAVPGSPTVNITLNGGVLMNNNTAPTLHANRTILVGDSGGYMQAGWSQNLTINGKVTGSGWLTFLNDSGWVILTNANDYTGTTTINSTGGRLQLGNGGTTGSLSPSSSIVNNGFLGFKRSDTLVQGTDFASVISGSGQVIQAGSGTLVLSGANTYTGATTVNAGTLQSGANDVLPNASNVTVSGNAAGVTATLDLAGYSDTIGALSFGGSTATSGAAVTMGAGTLTLGGNVTYANANNPLGATIGGNLALGSATRTFTVGDSTTAANDLTVSAGISGSGVGLSKAGTGILLLSGTNTYTGLTTVSAGTLAFAKKASLYNGDDTNWTPANITVESAATLAVGLGDSPTYLSATDLATLLDGAHLGSSTPTTGLKSGAILGLDTTNATGGTFTYNAAITDPGTSTLMGLTKLGAGNLILGGVNTYSGGTNIIAGTLSMGSGTLGATTGALTLGGGSLDLNTTSQTVGAVSITAAAASGDTIGNGDLTGASYAASNTTGNAIVSANLLANAATFTKTGAGTVTLSGTNAYTGATAINGGTLWAAKVASLPGQTTPALITVAGGATLAVNAGGTGEFAETDITNLLTNATFSAATSTLAIDTTNAGGTFTYAPAITGAKAISKLGANELVLSNAGNNYTGTTTVNAGTLTASGGTVTSLNVLGGTANLNSPATATAANVTGGRLNLNSNATALTVSGASSSVVVGSGGVTVGTANFGAGTTVTADTPLAITGTMRTQTYAATFTPGGGATSFTVQSVSGSNIADNSAARTLSLSGGKLTLAKNQYNYRVVTGANSGISSSNTYTHAIDFSSGSNGAAVSNPINGVTFQNYFGSTTMTGSQGAGSNTSGNPGNFQTDIPQATYPGLWTLYNDFRYGASPNNIVLTGLTPGAYYETRLYCRTWATTTDDRRQTFDAYIGDSATPQSTWIVNEDNPLDSGNTADWNALVNGSGGFTSGTAWAMGYVFQADAAGKFTLKATQIPGASLHVYGLTNEVVPADNVMVNLPNTTIAATASSELNLGLGGVGYKLGDLSLSGASTQLTLSGTGVAGASFDNISATDDSSIAAGVPISLRTGNVSVSSLKMLTVDTNFINGTAPTALNKLLSGTLALAGNNTYTGNTNVLAGTLLVNNTAGSGTGTGTVNVGSGATLGGTGAISGPVILAGILAPGNSIESIDTGDLTISSTGTLDNELGRDGTTPVSDLVNVTGAVALESGANLKLTLGAGLNDPVLDDIFYLVSNNDSDAVTGVFTKLNGTDTTLNEGSVFNWNTQYWKITYAADHGTGFTGGNDIALQVVPEPATLAFVALGGLGLLARRRRRA